MHFVAAAVVVVVPEALLARRFEPFLRVDAARSRDQGGVGLGLAIAQRAIQLHGGEVRVENVPAGGLRVRVWLPLREGTAEPN